MSREPDETPDGTEHMVRADEIRWTLDPAPRREDDNPVDVFALPQDLLLEYAFGSQDDLKLLRELLSESVTLIARLRAQLDQARREIRQLRTAKRS